MKSIRTFVLLGLGVAFVSTEHLASAACNTWDSVTGTSFSSFASKLMQCQSSFTSSGIIWGTELVGNGGETEGATEQTEFSSSGDNFGYYLDLQVNCIGQGWTDTGEKGPFTSFSTTLNNFECVDAPTEAVAWALLPG